MMTIRYLIVAGATAALLAAGPQTAQAQVGMAPVVIGSGGVGGVYYAAARELCRLINRQQKKLHVRCSADATPGSLFNLRNLRKGTLDIALAQSDWQYHAWKGTDRFRSAGPDARLRSAFSLHREVFTVIAAPQANIRQFADMKGRKVNIGARGSGNRATVRRVFGVMKWSDSDFSELTAFATADQAQALCDRKVDVLLFSVGHPNHSVAETIRNCGSRLIPLPESLVTEIADGTPYYDPAPIHSSVYGLKDGDIWSFGTTATVTVSAEMPADIVYGIVAAVFGQLRALRRAHPALVQLEAKTMTTEGMTAPLHDGAARYYREKNLR